MELYFPDQTRPGVSVVNCCMDRNEYLAQALPNWLGSDQVDEVVVVDWSSRTPVRETLGHLRDERLRIVRVEGEPTWLLACAYNLAARLATRDALLKLDADVTLGAGFFADNELEPGVFYRGNGGEDAGLTGMLFVRRADFLGVGGYNEFLRTYGWDDVDLFTRLQLRQGLERRIMKRESASHREHGHAERLARHPSLLGYSPGDLEELVEQVVERASELAISMVGESEQERRKLLRRLALHQNSPQEMAEVVCSLPTFHIARNQYLCESIDWPAGRSFAGFRRVDSAAAGELTLERDRSTDLAPPLPLMREAELHAFVWTFFNQYPELRSVAGVAAG